MLDSVLIPAFWATATQLVYIIIPVVVFWAIFKIVGDLLFRD